MYDGRQSRKAARELGFPNTALQEVHNKNCIMGTEQVAVRSTKAQEPPEGTPPDEGEAMTEIETECVKTWKRHIGRTAELVG
jgi:hypothetical protein